MASRGLTFLGAFVGSLIYRTVRDGGVGWANILDSAGAALIAVVLLALLDLVRKPKANGK